MFLHDDELVDGGSKRKRHTVIAWEPNPRRLRYNGGSRLRRQGSCIQAHEDDVQAREVVILTKSRSRTPDPR